MGFGKNLIKWVNANDTNILTGIGIGSGLYVGAYLWYRTGQKTKDKKIKDCWKVFILPTINTLVSTGLLIYSARIGNKRLAALGAAYNISEAALQSYIDKTKEVVGEKKANDIQQKVDTEIANNNNTSLILSDSSESVFVEPLTNRTFKSTWTKIQKAANELNAAALGGFDGRISLTDWFNKLGLKKTDISDEMGWDPQQAGSNGIIDIYPDAIMNDKGEPVGVIRYNTRPKFFE